MPAMKPLMLALAALLLLTSCVDSWPEAECLGNARPTCANGGIPICGDIAEVEVRRRNGSFEFRYDNPRAVCNSSGPDVAPSCENGEVSQCIPYRQITMADEDYMLINCPESWAPCGYEWPRIGWPNPWKLWDSFE